MQNTKRPTAQTRLQRKKIDWKHWIEKKILDYPRLIKLIIILDVVTICITHARHIKSGKLIKWLNLKVSAVPC